MKANVVIQVIYIALNPISLKGAETLVATFLLLKIKDLQFFNFGIMLLLTQKTKGKKQGKAQTKQEIIGKKKQG